MPRHLIVSFLTSVILLSCQTKDVNSNEQTNQLFNDTLKVAIFPYDTTLHLFSGYKITTLTKLDGIKIDSILSVCVDIYNKSEMPKQIFNFYRKYSDSTVIFSSFLIDLTKHRRQYIVTKNSKDEKIVWVNSFCDVSVDNINWRRQLILVDDGGSCYFQVKINLNTNKYFDFQVNETE